MDTCLHMTPKMSTMVPLKKIYQFKTISCKAKNTARQRDGVKSNFYEVLSLESNKVDLKAIKTAYRVMARRYHPDVCPPSAKEESTKRFIELTIAYDTLSDPVLRTNYDHELGLVDTLGSCDDMKRTICHRDVWERQLEGLMKRSSARARRKTDTYESL